MQLELELRDDAELPPPAAQRPEQVRVSVSLASMRLAFGADDLAETRLSMDRPCCLVSQPKPPPASIQPRRWSN